MIVLWSYSTCVGIRLLHCSVWANLLAFSIIAAFLYFDCYFLLLNLLFKVHTCLYGGSIENLHKFDGCLSCNVPKYVRKRYPLALYSHAMTVWITKKIVTLAKLMWCCSVETYRISRTIRRTMIFSLDILGKNNDECILILVIYWKKTGLVHTKISNHNIIYSS